MPWTGILAVFSLLALQLAITGVSLYAYNRIRSQQDSQGQQREAWSAELKLAVTNADSARRTAEQIETEHFKKLRALFEVQSGELASANARILALERELKVCQTKLASEERINRRDEKRRRDLEESAAPPAAKETAGLPTGAGAPGVDELLHANGIPLFAPQPAAPAAPANTFGKVAKARGG